MLESPFILFGTANCHLCEQAEKIIAQTVIHNKMAVETIDISEHPQWYEKYAIRIPVLYHPETKKDLGWPFTSVQVQAFINELDND